MIVFSFCWLFPLKCRNFKFDVVLLVYFFFCCLCFWCHIQEIIAKSHVLKLISSAFFRNFIALNLTFRSVIPCELIFCICCMIRVHIHSCLDIQFFQHHLLKGRLSPRCSCSTFVRNHLAIYARVYFRVLYSVPLVYVSVFTLLLHHFDYCCFVICFEIVKYEAFNFVHFKDCFGYS